MINKNNNKNKVRTDERFSAFLVTCFALFIGLVLLNGGVAATMSVYAVTTQTLPSCVDPTGQNLPCIMVISTLPPPPNAVQCQETSGQILACSYATQNLSNGEPILVITAYVPVNYVFAGYGPWTVMKQVVHEPTSTKNRPDGSNPPGHYTLFVTVKVGTDPIVRGHIETITVTVSDNSNHRMKIVGAKVSGVLLRIWI
jgi:hypothetical protein